MIKSRIAGDVRGEIELYVLNIFIDTTMPNIYPRSPLSIELYQRSYTTNAKFLVSFSSNWYKKNYKPWCHYESYFWYWKICQLKRVFNTYPWYNVYVELGYWSSFIGPITQVIAKNLHVVTRYYNWFTG